MEYIYVLKIDDEIIYAGQTNDVQRRFNEHKNDKSGSPKSKLMRKALKDGQKVEIEVVHEVEDGQLEGLESEVIDRLTSDGYRLTNRNGGNTGLLNSRDAAVLRKDIQEHKRRARKKPRVEGRETTVEERQAVKEALEAYRRGELSLDDLRAFSK